MKFLGVAAVRVNRCVGAKANLDALGQSLLKRQMHGSNGEMRFYSDGRRDGDSAVKLLLKSLNRHQCWDVICSALLHHVQSFVVHKTAVLDGINTRANGPLGGFGSVRMSGGLVAQGMRFIHNRV